jgi:hypothetical protein
MMAARIGPGALVGAVRLLLRTTIRLLLLFGILSALGLPGTLAAAQQFAADLVSKGVDSGAAQSPGKIYVSNNKVRLEMPDFPGGLFLLDDSAHTAYFVKPAQRVFMDAKQSTWLTQILVPVDPDNPCKEWRAMAEIAGAVDQGRQWRCNRLGPESAHGRNTIKFRAISPQGARYYFWIDPQLGFAVSVQREDGATIDLENVQEGPPPAGLFAIPANFSKFDPHQLIDRIKQSDVWVDPPK